MLKILIFLFLLSVNAEARPISPIVSIDYALTKLSINTYHGVYKSGENNRLSLKLQSDFSYLTLGAGFIFYQSKIQGQESDLFYDYKSVNPVLVSGNIGYLNKDFGIFWQLLQGFGSKYTVNKESKSTKFDTWHEFGLKKNDLFVNNINVYGSWNKNFSIKEIDISYLQLGVEYSFKNLLKLEFLK